MVMQNISVIASSI